MKYKIVRFIMNLNADSKGSLVEFAKLHYANTKHWHSLRVGRPVKVAASNSRIVQSDLRCSPTCKGRESLSVRMNMRIRAQSGHCNTVTVSYAPFDKQWPILNGMSECQLRTD